MLRKLAGSLALAVAVIILNFLLPRALPGSPIRVEDGALTASQREHFYEVFGLDRPLYEQFGIYLRSIFTGDLGLSYSRRAPISRILAQTLPWTILLSLASMLFSLVIGSLLGSLSVRLRKKRQDFPVVLGVSLLGSFPAFWVGMVLIAVFGVHFGILPMFGGYSLWANYTGLQRIVDVLRHMIMPLITVSIGSTILFFTTSRASLFSVLGEDYMVLAQARGLSKRRVSFFYQWRNAIIPVFTLLMMQFGFIFSGSVVVEAVFSYPGLGLVLYQAVLARDYPLMQYSFLLIAFTVIVMNFITDLLYPILDPRIRKS